MKTAIEAVNEFMTAHPVPLREDSDVQVSMTRAQLHVLITRAIVLDRQQSIDFEAVADKVLVGYTPGLSEHMGSVRHVILTALRYAQASGARFEGPSETDYAEAVASGIEAFTACLKDKGLWRP